MIIRREKFIALVIAFALPFLLYGNSLNGDFVSDDKLIILQNPFISGNFSDFFRAFSVPYYHNQPHAGLYRPLTIASFNLNRIFGSETFGFHFLNVILNAINGFLVFLLVSKLMPEQKKAPYLAAILFLFLPIHSEAVSSIVGRAELMSFLFSVLSLFFVLNKKYAIASVALLAGLLSKETAAGFFLVFLYLWKFKERKTLKQIFLNSLYFVPTIGVYAVLRYIALGKYFIGFDHLFAYNPLKFTPFFQSLWTSLKVFYLYLLKTIIPYQLSSDYSFNQIPIVRNPLNYEVYFAGVILAVLVWLAVKKRHNAYGLSAFMFLSAYILISNWFVKIGTIMGERLMYAPSLGLVILAAAAVESFKLKIKNPAQNGPSLDSPSRRGGRGSPSQTWRQNFKINDFASPKDLRSQNILSLLTLYFLLLTLLAWYGYIIIDRNRDWQNEGSLIRSGYAASPNSVVSLTNMAFLAFNEKNYEEAGGWATKALEVLPDHVPALYLYGHASKKQGDFKSTEIAWKKMIELNPSYVEAYLSLGILYYEQGRLDEAESVLEKGFQLEQTWGKAFPLAIVKTGLGKYDESIRLVINNFGADPEKRELKFALGLAYLKKGNTEKAEFYLNLVKNSSESMEDYFKKILNQKVFKITEY